MVKNPTGTLPCLELDAGTVLREITAICEYLDEITLCGDRLTLADIMLFAFLDFGAMVSQPINPDLKNIAAHHARMKGRPSAAA